VVMLKQELEFLRCYLEIEQVRFADRLTVDFQIEPATRAALVPHLILQPVVENAIRHAIAPRAADGHIQVRARRVRRQLRLEVTDNGPGLGAHGEGVEQRGRGLKNVRARLAQIYGAEFNFELTNAPGGGLTALLELPFRYEGDGALIARGELL
jgi:two-component system LytT family sensor kinase